MQGNSEERLRAAVLGALGEASVCWSNHGPTLKVQECLTLLKRGK